VKWIEKLVEWLKNQENLLIVELWLLENLLLGLDHAHYVFHYFALKLFVVG
jgi:hypothetical protein